MIWIFASIVLYLAVYHEGFRMVLLWCGGGAIAFLLIGAILSGGFH
jgi:hypothetical protein